MGNKGGREGKLECEEGCSIYVGSMKKRGRVVSVCVGVRMCVWMCKGLDLTTISKYMLKKITFPSQICSCITLCVWVCVCVGVRMCVCVCL